MGAIPGYDPNSEISTHAPLAGRDMAVSQERILFQVFQPTRPLRGATRVQITKVGGYISTHAPLAGRD